jgi:hypothetical protein
MTNLLDTSQPRLTNLIGSMRKTEIRRVWERGEEAPCTPTHVFAIGDHDPIVLIAVHLDRAEGLPAVAFAKLALTGGPQVPDPVGLSAARDEVSSGLVLERRYGRADRPATPPASNGERRTAETKGDQIHHVAHEEPRRNVGVWVGLVHVHDLHLLFPRCARSGRHPGSEAPRNWGLRGSRDRRWLSRAQVRVEEGDEAAPGVRRRWLW